VILIDVGTVIVDDAGRGRSRSGGQSLRVDLEFRDSGIPEPARRRVRAQDVLRPSDPGGYEPAASFPALLRPSRMAWAARVPSTSIKPTTRQLATIASAAFMLLLSSPAHASLLSEEAEDKLATVLALFVVFVVPIVLIALFWMVHILPEKIAHKRHHPQFEAIRTLCLLSLAFGGLLWPIAWIWAYTRPVLHKLAYGTDKINHDEPYPGETEEQPGVERLGDRLARLEASGLSSGDLHALRADIDALEAKLAGGAR
jgi:hypothetical protein